MEIFPILANMNLNLDPSFVLNFLVTLILVLILWMIRRGILSLVSLRIDDRKNRYNWRKITGYVFFLLALMAVIPLWIGNESGITTYLGLVTAGIAISLKDPLTNLAGWLFILLRHPFRVGNRIQIGDHAGDVIDIRVFQFSLLEIGNWVNADQSTGRIIHIPNGAVFTLPLSNYSQGFNYIWNEIPVNITFESDWKKAKALLQEIAEKNSIYPDPSEKSKKAIEEEYLIFYTHLTPTVYTNITTRGIELTIRYLCVPQQRRASSQAIWEDVLLAFQNQKGISFAYPTYRYTGEHEIPWNKAQN